MKIYRLAMLVSFFLMNGCAEWSIISVETVAYSSPYQDVSQQREKALLDLASVINSKKSDLDLKVYASFSYAALKLGNLSNPPNDANGLKDTLAPSLIIIDSDTSSRLENRQEAKKKLQYVETNLYSLKGNFLRDADGMRKKLSYVSYYLSLIDFLDGDIDSALKNLDHFDASNQFDSKGKNYSHALRDRIQNTIRVEALAREQKQRREESEKEAYIQRIESAKRADLEHKKNQRIRAERQLPHDKYIELLKGRSSKKISYKNSLAYKLTQEFRIDCNKEDWRYLPLGDFLLARIDELNREDSWLETSVDERFGVVRVFDRIVMKRGGGSDFALAFELSGDSIFVTRPEAVMAACNGAYGPIFYTR